MSWASWAVSSVPAVLMPNPKVGTVTMDVSKAVQEAKAGRVEYRVDKAGIIHCPVGKRSFSKEALTDNVKALYKELIRVKPSTVKGTYMKSAFMSTTMSPAVKLNVSDLA